MATTDYLKGSGTSSDPYVIHNQAALLQWLMNDYISGKYAVLACDIDLGMASLSGRVSWSGNFDGFGHTISGFRLVGQSYFSGSLKRITIKSFSIESIEPLTGTGGSWTDVVVTGSITGSYPTGTLLWRSTGIIFTRVLNNATCSLGGNTTAIDCYRMPGAGTLGPGQTDLSASDTPYLASNFPSLTAHPESWAVDGASIPRLINQDVSALIEAYAIKGSTKVGGVAKSRIVGGHSPVDFHLFAKVTSDPDDGSYLLNCGWYTDHVAVVHRDDYGKLFVASKAYVLGDRIHPATPNGYAYECTSAGTSDSAAPTDWPTTGTMTSGTAIFTPVPIYAPQTMLVVPVLYNLLTGEPVEA